MMKMNVIVNGRVFMNQHTHTHTHTPKHINNNTILRKSNHKENKTNERNGMKYY